MITLDSIYTIITPILGFGSAILAVFTFSAETIPALPVGADISPMTLIISLIATFLLGLMRTTNSVKNLEETNSKILVTQNEILKAQTETLKIQNELLKTLTQDSVKQDKLIELETKSLEANNKTLTSMNRMLIANAKKPDKSGTYPVDQS
jgi:phosphoribosylformylglycinamidine (FGAM) synthase PurS component